MGSLDLSCEPRIVATAFRGTVAIAGRHTFTEWDHEPFDGHAQMLDRMAVTTGTCARTAVTFWKRGTLPNAQHIATTSKHP